MFRTVIIGSGSYIPEEIKTNRDFTVHDFYGEDHKRIESSPDIIVQKFQEITGIEERRYATHEHNSSDLAFIASQLAIENAGIDKESLDQIIFAHNYGDVTKHHIQTDAVPALASRLKQKLGIFNPSCVAYDLLFGCPGWLQGFIHSDAFFRAGIAKRILVVGSETLSRVIDPYDRDSMIFSDGAGATVLEYTEKDLDSGMLSASAQSHCVDEAGYINFGKSYFPDSDPRIRYIKMKGRKVYEYAIKNVPAAMKDCLDKAGVDITEVKKVFIHQANEKMDEGIIKSLFRLYGLKEIPTHVMPMSIHKFGNSSVATIPTLYDMVIKNQMPDHQLQTGDIVLFASVGAGMNINAVCYKI
ncbi:MAG: 3-oxoacyl-ACP synthase III family protein [Saprospiraceae bacterium]|jgi:3-oxoacyl-[acyl-carrier-protein] synthase-3|nr:3-oxoacyl-ACP synthase III family protein [Saprospiraceae bacterium]